MQNKQKPIISIEDMPIIVTVVILVVGFGTVLGLIAYNIFGINKYTKSTVKMPSINVVESNYFGNEFIQVKLPQRNVAIKSPVLISGKANVFEANVRVRIKDGNENILADTFITASGTYDDLYPFKEEINYDMPAFQNGIIEIFEESAKDGSDLHKIEIPVVFEDYVDVSEWKTYRNEEYGFEVKYPKILALSENNNYKSDNDQIFDKVLLKFSKSVDNLFITISRFEIGKDQTFKDVITENSWLPGGGIRHEDFSKFKLVEVGDNFYYYRYFCGGISGSIEDGSAACDFLYHYWLVNDQSVFEFELSDTLATSIEKPDLENYENPPSHLEFKQILSTFKFIEK